MKRRFLALSLLLAGATQAMAAGCPYARSLRAAQESHPKKMSPDAAKAYREQVDKLDWGAVKKDIAKLLTTSQEKWPADFGNYGPLMIRLAWHCAGSYRTYDGLGGCDGAHIRFDPERSWDDNTNLDKARDLLWPIKKKYGPGLSWGDLIILTGNVAIESMGGPVLGFCAGRIDDADGKDSELLGPTPEQELNFPCAVQGECAYPLGQSTIGLIYVNPEGPMGQPIPEKSAPNIREVFGRMGMNDSETVALIGGGHAFGKTHGACPDGPGLAPKDDPLNSWPGKCGTGKGEDTFTSGFEGKWTATPTEWSNAYFTNLLDHEWEVHVGPGGKHQWQPAGENPDEIQMLTADVALLHDPEGEYQKLVDLYGKKPEALNDAFAHAWYKLTTRDMGPVTRCLGPNVPPAQPFQGPLPKAPAKLADFAAVKKAISKVAATADTKVKGDTKDKKAYYGALFAQLAWNCAATFRNTDYQGGCNGARIRLSPEKEWPGNKGMDSALKLLEPVKKQFGDSLSWADLIVLAGTVSVEEATGKTLPFCGGRTDATDGSASKFLKPIEHFAKDDFDFRWTAKALGLGNRHLVALYGGLRSPQHMKSLGYTGTWSDKTGKIDNSYFTTLLTEKWALAPAGELEQYQAGAKKVFMTPADMLLLTQADLLAIAQEYAADNKVFVEDFNAAWTRVMINDRFDGPAGNVCDKELAQFHVLP